MATGRNQVDYTGLGCFHAVSAKIDDDTITYSVTATNGSAAVGKAVTLSANDTVALVVDGDAVFGKLLAVESDGICTVQREGYVTLPGGSGADLTRGLPIVGAVGAASAPGYIRAVDSEVAAELAKMTGDIVNNAATTAVVVRL